MELKEFKKNPMHALELAISDDVQLVEDGAVKFELTAVDEEEEAWEEALLHDPRFIARLEHSRKQGQEGRLTPLEAVDWEG